MLPIQHPILHSAVQFGGAKSEIGMPQKLQNVKQTSTLCPKQYIALKDVHFLYKNWDQMGSKFGYPNHLDHW